jgi:hypothetical protein
VRLDVSFRFVSFHFTAEAWTSSYELEDRNGNGMERGKGVGVTVRS